MSSYFQSGTNALKRSFLLDSTYFDEWEKHTRNIIRVEDEQLLKIIENGPLKITKVDDNGGSVEKNKDEWDEEDYNKCMKNARALHILYCALPIEEFYRVATSKTAKEIWDALKAAYGFIELANLFEKTSLQESTSCNPMDLFMPGHSTMRPPILSSDGQHFSWWKARMRAFIESTDPQLWHIIENGPLKITKLDENGVHVEKRKDDRDHEKLAKNYRAKQMLLSGVTPDSWLVPFSGLKTAKEMWDALNSRYEGDVSSLERKYEVFRMKKGESMKEMFGRFFTIVGQLALLGEEVSMRAQVRKILRSLPKEYEILVTIIRMGTKMYSLNALYSLLAREEPNN